MLVLCLFFFSWVESRCRSVSPDHHSWAGERGRLHHSLHGLLRWCVAEEGGEDSGYVCMPGPFRPISVGLYRRHSAAGGHSGVSPQLVKPSQTADGLGLLHDPLQLHVVCLRLLRSAGWVCASAYDMLCAGRRKEIPEWEKWRYREQQGRKIILSAHFLFKVCRCVMADVCECFVHQRLYVTKGEKYRDRRSQGKVEIIRKSYLHFLVFFQILKGSKAVFGQKMEKSKSGSRKGRGNLQKWETKGKKDEGNCVSDCQGFVSSTCWANINWWH